MRRKWGFFGGAVLLASYALIVNGAPPVAVLCGIVLAAAFTARGRQIA